MDILRHSTAHCMAMAVQKLFKGVKFAIGPNIENGFYYDFALPAKASAKAGRDRSFSPEDLPKIEKKMKELIKKDLQFKKREVSLIEAKKIFKNQPYKLELIKDLQKEKIKKVTVYTLGDFIDLCKGPHIKTTKEIKFDAFKLTSLAGAYWKGSEDNKMLQRIYGTVFKTKKELDTYLKQQKEAEKRDHRTLGQRLELFMLDDEVGQGLPLWLPKGAFVRHKIMEFALNTYLEKGYELVSTPHIASESLWKHSGHLEFYKEGMYDSFGIEDEQYRLKPMNCPLQVKMYNSRPRSYRELPLRWTEMGTVYRYEKSGTLHGLTRVRGFTQDDAHIICSPDQLHKELTEALKLTLYILETFGFKDFEMNLSIRDPKNKKKFIGGDQGWKQAEGALKKAMASVGYKKYVLDVGGAVFYGPKIDVKVADSLGRQWQLSTIQFDFNLPGRFKMKYTDKDGLNKEPFMIHRAILGSLERFMGVYIEHVGGAFPVWLSPVQAQIIPVGQKFNKYGEKIKKQLQENNIRVELNDNDETLGKKIRNGQIQKIPYLLIVGEKEEKVDSIAVRDRTKGDLGLMKINKFIEKIKKEIEEKK
ncbi:threonine--tRNA ligase [Patescibacteria group bacterium]|nr:threonine--tRNA ligase [Patescibacteria group bacterium]MBU1563844.1 threonine--tRNA ligase [Patescibacteria group bacterium]MBU2068356.1 threonine--tRNA ligase [Patescibacteria group bacterium]